MTYDMIFSEKEHRFEAETLFRKLIKDAHKRYVDAVGKNRAVNFLDDSLQTLDDLVAAINRQNEQFQTFRDQQRGIIDIIGNILRPVEEIGQAFSGVAEQAFAPSQAIFAAVRLLMGSAEGVSEAYDSIVDLFRRLQDFTTRLHFYTRESMSAQLRIKCVEIMAALFEVMLVAIIEIHRGRTRSYFRRLIGQGSPTQSVIEKLNTLVESETGVVMAETLAEIKRAITMQHHMEEEWDRFRNEAREQSILMNRLRIKEILGPSVYSEDRYRYLSRCRTEGTGEWLVKDPSFQAWFNGETQFMWLAGNPGTGKSFLASRVISWIGGKLGKAEKASPDSFAYFFFRDNRPETRSVHQAIRDLAYQLAEDDDYYSKTLLQNVQSSDDIKTITSAFSQLLETPAKLDTRNRKVYLIIDGMDEAESSELKQLFEIFRDIGHLNSGGQIRPTTLQVFMVGRPTLQDTVVSLQEVDEINLGQIVITTDRASSDVKAFITEEVRRSRILKRTDEATKKRIIDLLSEKVGGLFILAQFMLSDMNTNTHMSSILESVRKYPKKADDMLRQTISRLHGSLSSDQINDLNEILIWVTCAQETLKLSEITAILELRFGNPPLNLEETLRGPYSCFFTLIREDGLTTADLVRGIESMQRSPNIGVVDGAKPSYSPDYIAQRKFCFDSNIFKTDVTFFHASITEFFRKHAECISPVPGDKPCIGFKTEYANLHVLKTCLKVIASTSQPKRHNLVRYASWYWQEHLVAVDRSKVGAPDKRLIGQMLVRLLTERQFMEGWTQEEESLKLFTDRNMASLSKWLSDPDVLSGLSDEKATWVKDALSRPGGLVEKIGQLYATAWLDPAFNTYVPTVLCLKIVHSVAYIQSGKSWSDSDVNWSRIPALTRIETALEWAKHIPKSGHWHRRVGSTYLVFRMSKEAMEHYQIALKDDGNMVETYGRIAYCHFVNKDYKEALKFSIMCETLEKKSQPRILSGHRSKEESYSAWRFYSVKLQIAECYRHLRRIDEALEYYQDAIIYSYEPDTFEPEAAYLAALGKNNKHKSIMALMKRMNSMPSHRQAMPYTRLHDFLVYQAALGTLSEWTIPRAACVRGDVKFMADAFRKAIKQAMRQQDTAKELYLRLALGMLRYYSHEYEAVVAVHKDFWRPGGYLRGSLLVRRMHLMSLRSLAQVYKQLVVSFGVHSTQAAEWIQKLDDLQDDLQKHQRKEMPQRLVGMDVNDAKLFRGLIYRLSGDQDKAYELISGIITENLVILDDKEPENDPYALDNIARALVAIGDNENARALYQSLRKPIAESLSMAMTTDSMTTNADSVMQPLLPYMQLSPRVCAQCLHTLGREVNFVVCTHCLAVFCVDCLERVIKVGDRAAALARVTGRSIERLQMELQGKLDHMHKPGQMSRLAARVVVCSKTHEWFLVPGMTVRLRRGEIQLADGRIEPLEAWKQKLRDKYVVGGIGDVGDTEEEEEEEGDEETDLDSDDMEVGFDSTVVRAKSR